MKLNIRGNVFETNSSSSHSVTVAKAEIFDRGFDKDALREGVVIMEKRDDYDVSLRLYKPENILAFLISCEIDESAYPGSDLWDALGLDTKSETDRNILPAIRRSYPAVDSAIAFLEEHTGAAFKLMIKPDDSGSFSTGNLSRIEGNLHNRGRLMKLLFNSRSFIELTEENGFAGEEIDTDLGTSVPTGRKPHGIGIRR